MALDARSVVDFLLERGAMRPSDVLDGGLSVRELSSRNSNFAVRAEGVGLFVKQAPPDDDLHRASLLGETRILRAASRDQALAAMREVAPAHRLDDEAEAVLVLDLVDGVRDLARAAAPTGGIAPDLAAALGRAVGDLHRDTAGVTPSADGVVERRAWILFFPELEDAALPQGSAPHRQLQRIVRENAELAGGLTALREGWRSETLMHGDLRWENVLVDDRAGASRIWLVDWEMAGRGDPAWDVGALLHSFLRHWVGHLHEDSLADGATPSDLFALRRMWPAVAATWTGYVESREMTDSSELLDRATRMCGARLLQTAFEHVSGSGRLTHHALGLTQLAANMMSRPADARRTLLGIETVGPG